jgi:RNA polymerase sigma-70 factor (ECF subfamily)
MTSTRGRADASALADGELLARVQARDREAYEVLFHRYYPRVYAFVQRRLGDAALAEETVVDTFFEVWRSAHAFRAEAAPASWIFGIAQFKTLAASRHRSRAKRAALVLVPKEDLERAPEESAAESQLAARDELRRLRRVLSSMGELQRRTAELVWLEGLSHEEAAAQLGTSADSVKARLWRARQQLRQELRPRSAEEKS